MTSTFPGNQRSVVQSYCTFSNLGWKHYAGTWPEEHGDGADFVHRVRLNVRGRKPTAAMSGFAVAFASEDQIVEFVVAQYPSQLQETKEGNESRKHDDTAREQVIDAHIVDSSGQAISMQEPFDRFLNHVKGEYQQAKQESLIKS